MTEAKDNTLYVIVNPHAGAGKTARQWPLIEASMQGLGLRFEHALTEAPGHAMELAAGATRNGYRTVVAVGGDGTVHELANGIWQAGALEHVSLGVVSTGTGSDFLRSTPIPGDYEAACRRLVEPMTRRIDLGVMEYQQDGVPAKRCFVNMAGIGFDAEVVRTTTLKYKSLGAAPAYLLGLLTTFLTYRARSLTLNLDGDAEKRRVFTVMMGNGKYGGGGMMTTPDAELDDGLFDVMVIGNINALDLISQLPKLYQGTHVNHPKVDVYRAARVEITPTRPMALQADGELLGQAPAVFSLLPGALELVV
jgi:diacylglycerol kinase (ATP)